jgi:ABC-type bacteriocin/lantibiotic exporter with double-glycine peptidase domain
MRMRIHLEVPVFRQETGYECGSTSLKSVLWYHKRRVTAEELRRLCGVRRDGVDHGKLVRGAEKLGATVLAKSGGTLAELRGFLRDGLPIIVGWWSRDPEADDVHFQESWPLPERRRRDCGHYSVVSGISDERIWLMDPQQELSRGHWRVVGDTSMTHRDFLEVWYDTDTDRYVRVDRWMMVVRFR